MSSLSGRAHFTIFLCIEAFTFSVPFLMKSELNLEIGSIFENYKVMTESISGNREIKMEFASEYFSRIQNKKIQIKNPIYFTIMDGKAHYLEKGYGRTYLDNSASTDKEGKMRSLYSLHPGDEIIVSGYSIDSKKNSFLEPLNVSLKLNYKNNIFNFPIETFDRSIMAPEAEQDHKNEIAYPQTLTACESIWSTRNSKVDTKDLYPADKNVAYKEIKEKYDFVKKNNPFMKEIGELYLKDDLYCFDMNAKSKEEELTFYINRPYIFRSQFR